MAATVTIIKHITQETEEEKADEILATYQTLQA